MFLAINEGVQSAKIEVVSDSVDEPISLYDAKKWLRVDSTDDDDFISGLITASVEELEAYLKQPILPKTINFYTSYSSFDDNGDEFIYIPYDARNTPTVSIFSEGDTENSVTTFKVYGKKINLGSHGFVPRENHGYKINYIAGISGDVASCPEGIKYALKELISLKYDWQCGSRQKSDILGEVSHYVNISQMYA